MTMIYKDLGWNKIYNELMVLNNKSVEIGLFDAKLAQIGFFNEYGTKKIVETSFLRSTLTGSNLTENKAMIQKALVSLYKGSSHIVFLQTAGEHNKKLIKKQIQDKIFEPNKPSTVAQKGFDHRLINKGDLYNAINYKVKE